MKKSARPARFQVLYEDSDIIAVNKAAGILSVPFQGGDSPNVYGLLKRYLARKKQRPSIVHRIDRYTSGILVFAKHDRARENLVRQFMRHLPRREYLAIVRGEPARKEGILVHHLRQIRSGFRQTVQEKPGKDTEEARLRYRVLRSANAVSIVAISLDTGLKNQIRAQFAAIGHPVVGDRQYSEDEAANSSIDHQALHAGYLQIVHPRTGKKMQFSIEPPRDFREFAEKQGVSEGFQFPYW